MTDSQRTIEELKEQVKTLSDKKDQFYREEYESWKSDFEFYNKGINYLLAANSAAMLACLAALKDLKDAPYLKGIGALIMIFAVGLFMAVSASTALSYARTMILNALRLREPGKVKNLIIQVPFALETISGALFILGVLIVAFKLVHL